MDKILKCNRGCGTAIEFRHSELKQKKLPWDIAKNKWHECTPITTIINVKPVMWHCWECGKKINIAGNPCVHFMHCNPTERYMIMEQAKKQ